ncbi:MAG: LysM peptidoglycan-binding domain-containing protein [Bacteroidota bacterium]
MKQVNVLLLFFLLTTVPSLGTSIYIDYNASKDCMDSYEYAKDGNEETPYLFFHLKVSDNEKIILEAGEDYTPRQYKPAGTESCAELDRDEQFVDDVNKGTMEVFIVQEHTYGFRIYKVKKAEYYYNTNISFGSKSETFKFAYYYNQSVSGNLATKGSKADVFFSEKDDKDCLTRYKFRVKTDPTRNGLSDMTILPEIGVLYKKSDPMPPLAVGEKLELRKINNYNIVDYLGLICKFYGGKPNTNTTTSTTATNSNNGNTATPINTSPTTGNTNTTPTTVKPVVVNPSPGGINVVTGNNGSTGTVTGSPYATSTSYPGSGRIYLDLDKGVYMDSYTGELANGEYGGNFYRNGYMVNKNTGGTIISTSTDTNTSTSAPSTTEVVEDNQGCLEVSTSDTHIVQKKETLYSIARTYGLNIKEVKKWNGIGANNRIYPCMRLAIVPPVDKTAAKGASSECMEQPTYNTHVVQKGETLYSIAATYGISVNQIKAWNGLRRNAIYPCTRLTIQPPSDYQVSPRNTGNLIYVQAAPETIGAAGAQPIAYSIVSPKGARYHTVAKNETLYKIARLYQLDLNELKRINGLTSNIISVGQVLLIAQAVEGTAAPQAVAVPQEYIYVNPAISGTRAAATQPIVSGKGDGETIEINVGGTQRLVHIVQDEDTLNSIAKKYNTTVAKLRALNDMDRNEVIVPFQRLYVQ